MVAVTKIDDKIVETIVLEWTNFAKQSNPHPLPPSPPFKVGVLCVVFYG